MVGATLAFAHTLGEFGVVMLIGGSIPGIIKVASVALYNEVQKPNYAVGGVGFRPTIQGSPLTSFLLGQNFADIADHPIGIDELVVVVQQLELTSRIDQVDVRRMVHPIFIGILGRSRHYLVTSAIFLNRPIDYFLRST